MKRAIFFISAIIIISSFSSQLLALPEGAVARLGKGSVDEVTFSPDGKILAVASSIGVWLYDAHTFAEIGFMESNEWLTSIAFSPDGNLLASGGDKLWRNRKNGDNTIKLWDIKSRTDIATLSGHNSAVCSVAFNPDGSLLASGDADKIIKLWDVKSRTNIATLKGHTYGATSMAVNSVAFSPDGSLLASGSDDKTIKLWEN
ncbi:MAG: WD40 repeat domain-containing protein [Candidatus Taylorbacteria bacterium]|nr:WD40 repeat domain-containing protein [Candidatus Taylorbacteria bacterium]